MASMKKTGPSKWTVRWRELPSPECPKGERTQTENDEERAKDVLAEANVIEAHLKLQARRSGITREKLVERSKTYKEVGDAWLATHAKKNTHTASEVRLRLHIYPILGDRPIREILPSELIAVVKSWKGFAKSTQVTHWRALVSVFTYAIGERILDRDENPCKAESVKKHIPRLAKRETADAWSEDWVRDMYANIREDISIFVLLGAWCGLRQGEIFGLSPDDIVFNDEGKRVIRVKRQVLLDNNAPYFGPLKHREHEDDPREVEVPDFVWEVLEDFMEDYPPRKVTLEYDKGDGTDVEDLTVKLFLVTREGLPWNRNYFNTAIWKPALIASGIPAVRANGTHALRHWFAVDFIYNGGSLAALSDALGHYDRTFTLNTYQRWDRRGVENVTSARDAAGRALLRRDASEPDDGRSPGLLSTASV